MGLGSYTAYVSGARRSIVIQSDQDHAAIPVPLLCQNLEVPAPPRGCIQPFAHFQVRRCTMAIMDANYDQEMMRLWGIISDLSDQLNEHRATASMLRNQAEGIKVSLRHKMDAISSESPHTGCSSAIEPGHSHSNRFRVAQVCVCDRSLALNYAHHTSMKVQYG